MNLFYRQSSPRIVVSTKAPEKFTVLTWNIDGISEKNLKVTKIPSVWSDSMEEYIISSWKGKKDEFLNNSFGRNKICPLVYPFFVSASVPGGGEDHWVQPVFRRLPSGGRLWGFGLPRPGPWQLQVWSKTLVNVMFASLSIRPSVYVLNLVKLALLSIPTLL